ncbi:hypothetical protein A9255_16975 [Xenorhabdus hominickii]|uniref:Transposase n=1 Tax=Xenorhabdus hominickii TaxID=351679 RepID=A0ABN4S6R6_XENHO|nr:hypothetical protein A9255_16975 [Xenorhabdus hominickii]
MDFKIQRGGRETNPQKHNKQCDWGSYAKNNKLKRCILRTFSKLQLHKIAIKEKGYMAFSEVINYYQMP